jgi:hypothetical protein
MIRNRNIDSLREQRVIPWNEFNVTVGTASGGAGAVTYEELSTFAYGGIGAGASGDEFSALDLVTPSRMDPRHEIGARIIWTVEGTVATDDAILWQVRYDQCDIGESLVVPQSAGAGTGTDLDTVIASQSPSVATSLKLYRTSRGTIDKNSFDFTARQGVIAWNVEAGTLTQFGPNEAVFLGLIIDYIPLWTMNPIEQDSGALTVDLTAA